MIRPRKTRTRVSNLSADRTVEESNKRVSHCRPVLQITLIGNRDSYRPPSNRHTSSRREYRFNPSLKLPLRSVLGADQRVESTAPQLGVADTTVGVELRVGPPSLIA